MTGSGALVFLHCVCVGVSVVVVGEVGNGGGCCRCAGAARRRKSNGTETTDGNSKRFQFKTTQAQRPNFFDFSFDM
jgi:hypothetical protein